MFIKIEGYGLQTYAGKVPLATYEYFEKEGIDLEEYNNDIQDYYNESTLNIPEEHNFAVQRGSCLYDVNDLWDVQGAVLDEDNTLTVEVDGKPDWECNFSVDTLESHGIKLFEVGDSEDIIYALPSPTAIFMGTQVLKGLTFGDNEVKSDSDFDPKQLEIYYHNHNDGNDLIVKSIKYAEQELCNNWLDVDVKSDEYEWIVK